MSYPVYPNLKKKEDITDIILFRQLAEIRRCERHLEQIIFFHHTKKMHVLYTTYIF